MAQKIIVTKQELKKQKDQLKRFQRYLPTLILKMQQLKVQLDSIEKKMQEKRSALENYLHHQKRWRGVFGENIELEKYIHISGSHLTYENLAGLVLPNFVCLNFEEKTWDLIQQPVWVDAAVSHLKERLSMEAEIAVIQGQHKIVADELLVTTQRVNLFEKIKIPETKNTIRRIKIYLGDSYTSAVVRGKIAKNKIERRPQ